MFNRKELINKCEEAIVLLSKKLVDYEHLQIMECIKLLKNGHEFKVVEVKEDDIYLFVNLESHPMFERREPLANFWIPLKREEKPLDRLIRLTEEADLYKYNKDYQE